MKRKTFSLFLCACLLLSGCTAESGEGAETAETPPTAETSPEETDPAETTPSKTEETAAETTEDDPFLTVSEARIYSTMLNLTDPDFRDFFGGGGLYSGNEIAFSSFNYLYLGEGLFRVIDQPRVRESSRKLAVTEEEKAAFSEEIQRSEFIPFGTATEASAYTGFKASEMFFTLDNLSSEYDLNGSRADLTNVSCGYTLSDEVAVNAFVKSDGDGNVVFIPDPAYLYGIPVFGRETAHLTFDLDGTEVMMDSFPVTCQQGDADVPERYIYARVRFSDLVVGYDFEEGYDCTAKLLAVEPITDDLNEALSESFVPDDPDKDPEMSMVYRALAENIDLYYKDTTHGIVLLDLDFDGTPELLVSDVYVYYENEYRSDLGVNVSVYRIEDGELKYIDSFQNAHRVVYAVWNSLGKKTLPDGSVGWFSTSPDDNDYLYRLEGDRLIATPIFTREVVSETTDEYGNTSYEYDYYYMGDKIVPIVTHEELSEDNPISDTHYEWNGSYSYFGEMWELFGMAREAYCADITETYSLYSDFLTELTDNNLYEYRDPIKLTKRELSYSLAYMVDGFYLGEYDSESRTYGYRFLGDYAKPVIYLYPEEETEVSVRVDFTEGGELTCTYPDYGDGWSVTAFPDGTLYDKDGNEYYCLYWEGEGNARLEEGKGWCVPREDTASFLREKLLAIGLTAREANEFIIYWLPELQKNPYNVISFHTDDYADSVPLTVTPAPDTVIRVFMTFEPCDEPTEIEPQALPSYAREGFTVVEWGGSHG
ncbi:MAG: hypothetical protein NC084_08295 [Bacteroides sp.]|nr:hypothetical protein [Eubacterium sp.]MCM1418642.1 hypothetical protein [Roseburia sp.]MCM1462696.1 hypothetical protein [Bacteroides sp.]